FSLPDLKRPCTRGRSDRRRAQAAGDAGGVIDMARARQAAKSLTAVRSDPSPALDGTVLSVLADLEGHDLNGLRRRWRAHLGGEPPAHLQRWLLMRVLADRLQPMRSAISTSQFSERFAPIRTEAPPLPSIVARLRSETASV
ncbi:MAG TPA: hypothetical protein VGG77_11975, partial [Roseiarcus sp.]